jgi:hypothetical protein
MHTKTNAPDSTSKGANTNTSMVSSSMVFVKQKAKLYGVEIHKSSDGYLVSRWGLTKAFSDSDDVVNFLKRMGVET